MRKEPKHDLHLHLPLDEWEMLKQFAANEKKRTGYPIAISLLVRKVLNDFLAGQSAGSPNAEWSECRKGRKKAERVTCKATADYTGLLG